MKRNYDLRVNLHNYTVGDKVWYFDPKRIRGLNSKLQRPWKGPFEIISKLNDVLYRIQESPRHKPKIVHHDKLKSFHGEVISPCLNINT